MEEKQKISRMGEWKGKEFVEEGKERGKCGEGEGKGSRKKKRKGNS